MGYIHFFSCYTPPIGDTKEFIDFLDRLTDDAKKYPPVAIAGVFNAWAVDWGSKETNSKGYALIEAFSRLDIVLLNAGKSGLSRKETRAQSWTSPSLVFASSQITTHGR